MLKLWNSEGLGGFSNFVKLEDSEVFDELVNFGTKILDEIRKLQYFLSFKYIWV